MADLVSVWTRNDSPEWLDRNAGCSDVLVIFGVPRRAAEAAVTRMRELYGDPHLKIYPMDTGPVPRGSVGRAI